MLIGRQNAPRPPATVDITLPSGWDGAFTINPVNSAALKAALDDTSTINTALASGHYIIELDKDTTYSDSGGTFVVDNGDHNEKQRISITGSPTGGTFTLSFDGQGPTAGIAYNATAEIVQLALETLSNIGLGDVLCISGPLPGTNVDVHFTGALATTDVAEMTTNGSGLTGGSSPDSAITTIVTGRTGYSGTNWIIIRSSGFASIPAGTRVTDATNLATILQSDNGPCFRIEHAGHHIRIVGIEFTVAAVTTVFVMAGYDSGIQVPSIQAEVGNFIGFDRCYIHSTSATNRCRLGISVSINNFFCVDSRIENIKDTADAQAILFSATDGPIHIENTFLEGSGENIMSGGNDVRIQDQIPSDFTFSRCLFIKPNEWDIRHASYDGFDVHDVKNTFELKMARRVLISGCVFDNHWADAQQFMLALTVRNQSGGNRWVVNQDVLFENCLFKKMGRFCNILASDDLQVSGGTNRFTFRNCLIHTCGGTAINTRDFGLSGEFISVGRGGGYPITDLLIDHCTLIFQEGHLGNMAFGDSNTGTIEAVNWTIKNSIFDMGNFGGHIDAEAGVRNGVMDGNGIFYNTGANSYASKINDTNFATNFPGNVKANTITLAKFIDNANQDYTLASDSPFKGVADDGRDAGVDFIKLNAAIAGVE